MRPTPLCTPSTLDTRRLDEEKDPKHADKEPNGIENSSSAGEKSLAVKDKAVLYGAGSSDPRVRFKITGTKDLAVVQSASKKVWTRPWRETFFIAPDEGLRRRTRKPIDFGINGPILEVTCEDIDAVSSADFMGELDSRLCTASVVSVCVIRSARRRRGAH